MRIIYLSASFLATSLAYAATPVDGLYLRLFGGYTYLPNNVSITSIDGVRNSTSYVGGYNAGGGFGYQSHPLRYEIEYTYLSAGTDSFSINYIKQTGVKGNAFANLFMANIYYDCPELIPAIAPYLGIGIGYANLQTTLNSTGPAGLTYFRATDNEFAYQGTLGLTYNFAENYGAHIGYRYAATNSANHFGKIFQAQMVNAGVIFHFDTGNYK